MSVGLAELGEVSTLNDSRRPSGCGVLQQGQSVYR
jgi:hypothetical protein